MRLLVSAAVLMGLALVGCGREAAVAQRGEEVSLLLASVDWPQGYELTLEHQIDPSTGIANERSGATMLRFSTEGQTIPEIWVDFHRSLSDAGFASPASTEQLCDSERLSALYQTREPFTSTELRYEIGDSFVSIAAGWDIDDPSSDLPPLIIDDEDPVCG